MEPEEIKYFSEKEMRIYDYINKNPYEIIVDDFIAEYILVIKG